MGKYIIFAKRILAGVFAAALAMSCATVAFAETLYTSSSKTVDAGKTWNSYLYDPGSYSVAELSVTIPNGGYAALMSANSASGSRSVTAMGGILNEYTNRGTTSTSKKFSSMISMAGGDKYFGIRLKNTASDSRTFTNLVLKSHGTGN